MLCCVAKSINYVSTKKKRNNNECRFANRSRRGRVHACMARSQIVVVEAAAAAAAASVFACKKRFLIIVR